MARTQNKDNVETPINIVNASLRGTIGKSVTTPVVVSPTSAVDSNEKTNTELKAPVVEISTTEKQVEKEPVKTKYGRHIATARERYDAAIESNKGVVSTRLAYLKVIKTVMNDSNATSEDVSALFEGWTELHNYSHYRLITGITDITLMDIVGYVHVKLEDKIKISTDAPFKAININKIKV